MWRLPAWALRVPVRFALEHAGGAEQPIFRERGAEELNADRQARLALAGRQGDARQTGEVGADGIDVGQVHRQRIVDQLADFERRRRRHGREEQVARLEGPIEIVANQPADFERLEIIGVVIAGREGVVAQHDAAFDFVPKAFAARGGVHVDRPSKCSARCP